VRWRLVDLCQWAFEEFRVTVSVRTVSRELRLMGCRRRFARPHHHAQAERVLIPGEIAHRSDFKLPTIPI
jgi:hypothetical protein